MSGREKLLHPATIIATVALFVALGGTGYAAAKIGTGELKNGAVTRAKIKNNAVNSAKLAGGAVRGADLGPRAVGRAALANGAVTGDKLATNAVTGAKIAAGAVTAAKIAPGQVVTGGGALVSGRRTLDPASGPATVLTMPGIAVLDVFCSPAGVPNLQFTNVSGSPLTLVVAGVNGPATARAGSITVAPGAAIGEPNPASNGAQGLTFQLSYSGAGGVPHVATVMTAMSPAEAPATGCVASAQALTTG